MMADRKTPLARYREPRWTLDRLADVVLAQHASPSEVMAARVIRPLSWLFEIWRVLFVIGYVVYLLCLLSWVIRILSYFGLAPEVPYVGLGWLIGFQWLLILVVVGRIKMEDFFVRRMRRANAAV